MKRGEVERLVVVLAGGLAVGLCVGLVAGLCTCLRGCELTTETGSGLCSVAFMAKCTGIA